jgi:hypothetical protein
VVSYAILTRLQRDKREIDCSPSCSATAASYCNYYEQRTDMAVTSWVDCWRARAWRCFYRTEAQK